MPKILLIEDTPEIRHNVLDFLEAEDFEVMAASNGKDGVKLAKENLFDLILCDIMMPELDGYGVLTELRQDPKTVDIPFIFMTAKGERSDLRLGMTLGADDYLTKPFTPAELLDAITARLNRIAHQNEKLRQVTEQLEQLETIDVLTGLPNQLALQAEAGIFMQAIAKSDRHKKLVPFLLLGLDRFGRINDAIGYSNGNIILQKFAERLLNFTKVVEQTSVARISGDEFAILLPPVANQESAVAIAQDILKLIAQPFNVDGKPILITGSIGIAFYPLAPSLEEVQRQASIAMGSAKREGGNRSAIYHAPLFGNDASRELELAADFHRAWQQESLQVFYQPRVDIRSKKILALAAVPYWKHPVKGVISLEKLLAVAEEAGLTLTLNEWVLHSACQQLKIWRQSGISTRIAVRISQPLFINNNLEQIITKSSQDAGIDPRYLELEIAADTIAKSPNINATAAKLMAWQRQGMQTTISKFGIGHTTLDYLGQLALNNLKIDRNLASNISQNTPILNAIIEMGHRLKLRVVAEGIETEAQANLLKKQKCDEIQQEESFSATEIYKLLGKR